MFPSQMSLPHFHFTGGETKNITIPIFNKAGNQIDAYGMTARLVISDYVNLNMDPLVIKDCKVIPGDSSAFAVLFTVLEPKDTVNLSGKFIYQVTGKDVEDAFGVMQGFMTIAANRDREAILM